MTSETQSANTTPYPLYNTTFTLHRLNISLSLTRKVLEGHARSLRDILVGDVLRGVRVDLGAGNQGERDAVAGVGALRGVRWSLLGDEGSWDGGEGEDERDGGDEGDGDGEGEGGEANGRRREREKKRRGVLITVTYEKAVYKAIMMMDPKRTHDEDGDVDMDYSRMLEREDMDAAGGSRFPLLMTKMSPALRESLINYLTSTFDVRISPLYLSSEQLVDITETYIASLFSLPTTDNATPSLQELNRILRKSIKDVVFSFGFDIPGSTSGGQLKAVDITIQKEDVMQMIREGEGLISRRGVVKGGKVEEGKINEPKRPFWEGLAGYAKYNLAMEIRDQRVQVKRIACGTFVIGGLEGRVKLTEPRVVGGVGDDAEGEGISGDDGEGQRKAMRGLVDGLVELARRGGIDNGNGNGS